MSALEIKVNGEDRSVASGTTVALVVDNEACTRRGIAVALNGSVVARSAWDATPLRTGDEIEILGVAAGG